MKYTTLNNYLKERFGEKVYKIALNGGFTCPNRDGSIDTRGCIFCSKGGSGDFAESPDLTITEQIENGKKRLEKKIKNGKYIAYFQAFTNTYAPVERLRMIYEEAINHHDIVALSIGTINEDTARYIRRGYTLKVYDKAVTDLHKIGINVVTHIILGLPNESKEDMLNSVEYACKVTDGIKLQLLHILKGTDLAKDYKQGKFEVLTLEQYTEIIKECVQIIPENVVIHRLTGDGAKKDLIAPLWSADKKTVLNTINRALKDE